MAQVRREVGMTQRAVADALRERFGVSITRQALSNYERGKILPDIIMARRIASVLGVPLDLIEFEEPASQPAKTA